MKKTSLIIALFIGFSSFGQSKFYVSKTGNDNTGTGTLSAPFATLTAAINAANSGDIIELRGGTYVSNEIRINKSNLTIRSFQGEKATLQAIVTDENISSCLWFNEPETTGGLLENLEIIGGYYYGIKFESNWDWDYTVPFANRKGVSNVTIRNCHIHHTGRDGIKLTPASNYITIENCEIDHTGTGPGALIDLNAEGIDNVNASFMHVKNCYIHDVATTGLYVKGGGKNCLIENNLIENTGEGGIYMGFYTDAEWFDTDANPEYYENMDGVVINNIIVNTKHGGIGLFGAKNPKIINNTIINAASTDVYAALILAPSEVWVSDSYTAMPPNLNVTLVNNIFTQTSNAIQPMVRIRQNALSGNTLWSNNLYFKAGADAIFVDDNLTGEDLNYSQWLAQSNKDQNSLLSDPLLSSNHHLLQNSPCINAGLNRTEITVDVDGHPRNIGKTDIGADEYGSSVGLIEALANQKNIKVWSNSTEILVQIEREIPLSTSLSCIDSQGKTIFRKEVSLNIGTNKLAFPKIKEGLYFLKIDQTNEVRKFIIN